MNTTLPIKHLHEQRRLVFGFIHALTRDVDASEEIFQDVSVNVLEQSARQAPVQDFIPWILGVTRNRVADYYRRRGRSHPVPDVLVEAVAETFEQNAENRDEAARRIAGLLECVDELPPRQKQIVEVRYRDRKSLAEVAAAVGWKSDAVKVALSKIRKALLACLRGKQLVEGAEL